MLELLSERGKTNVRDLPALVKAHFDALNDMYHPINNPNGYINFGTAETKLVDEEAIKLLNLVSNRMNLKPENLHYNKFHGTDAFREGIANYWQNIIFPNRNDRNITKDNIASTCGCTEALEMLAFLLANDGDVFLIPAPYYSSFADDIHDRAGVLPVGVQCSTNLEKEPFQQKLAELKSEGKTVRAVLFSSPNNPVGTVYTPDAIKNIVEFCMDNDIDLISDEIYAETVFDHNAEYMSSLNIVPDEFMHRVHVTSSFAKDFALSGFRTGFCISYNPNIIKGMETISYYSSVSSYTQAILTELLKAPELSEFMATSRARLKETCEAISSGLSEVGIKTQTAQAGIFVWADLSRFLDENTFESEYALWERIYKQLKINISPGRLFCSEKPGWFRICYANSMEEVNEACRRLHLLLK